jgi:hypothetical protein
MLRDTCPRWPATSHSWGRLDSNQRPTDYEFALAQFAYLRLWCVSPAQMAFSGVIEYQRISTILTPHGDQMVTRLTSQLSQ